jgi:hypothetical protein
MPSGFHALANRGYGPDNLPDDMDQERVEIHREYIEWLAEPFFMAGLPKEKTYAHINFLAKETYDYFASVNPDFAKKSYAEVNYFGPPEVAIGNNYTPGFTTYPNDGVLDQIHELVNNAPWASAEGTNLIPKDPPEESGYNMESHLARHYNYGCRLVTIFAFNLQGTGSLTDALNEASEGTNAIEAYKKFLRGEELKE